MTLPVQTRVSRLCPEGQVQPVAPFVGEAREAQPHQWRHTTRGHFQLPQQRERLCGDPVAWRAGNFSPLAVFRNILPASTVAHGCSFSVLPTWPFLPRPGHLVPFLRSLRPGTALPSTLWSGPETPASPAPAFPPSPTPQPASGPTNPVPGPTLTHSSSAPVMSPSGGHPPAWSLSILPPEKQDELFIPQQKASLEPPRGARPVRLSPCPQCLPPCPAQPAPQLGRLPLSLPGLPSSCWPLRHAHPVPPPALLSGLLCW